MTDRDNGDLWQPRQGQGQQYPQDQPWQPQQYNMQQHQQRVGQPPNDPYASPPPPAVPQYAPQGYGQPSVQPAAAPVRKTGLTAAEKFWYVLGCIAFGAMYFAKIPSKKALADFGMTELTAAESFWYVLMCIAFGGGYFAKIPTAKAISELAQFREAARVPLEYRR
jgi:hypothetical protein